MNPDPDRSIEVQCYDGRPVLNWIDQDPAPNTVKLSLQFNSYAPYVSEVRPPTGRYNCHGLVFAGRRTNVGIPGYPVDLDAVLVSDGYDRVKDPRPGDVAVYRHASDGIEHTGVVARLDELGSSTIPMILSKWGTLGEYLHGAAQCTYAEDCTIEYWGLR